jgi:hypothetical protein
MRGALASNNALQLTRRVGAAAARPVVVQEQTKGTDVREVFHISRPSGPCSGFGSTMRYS